MKNDIWFERHKVNGWVRSERVTWRGAQYDFASYNTRLVERIPVVRYMWIVAEKDICDEYYVVIVRVNGNATPEFKGPFPTFEAAALAYMLMI